MNRIKGVGAEEMTQWLGVLCAPPDDPGSIPRTHIEAQNCLQLQFQGIQPITEIYKQGKSAHKIRTNK